MADAVSDINATHLKTLEDALNVVLAHPIFETIQSMQPAPIDRNAEACEAGSQVSWIYKFIGYSGLGF